MTDENPKPESEPKDKTPDAEGKLIENLDDIIRDFMGEPMMIARWAGDKPMPRTRRWAICFLLANGIEQDQTKYMLQFGLGERIGRAEGTAYQLNEGDIVVLKGAIDSADGAVVILKGTIIRMLEK